MQKSQTWVVILTLVLCLASAIPAHGQAGGGTVLGTVTDTSGARVPNAQVALKNAATNESRTVTANGDGFYNAPSLSPGNYDVTVKAAGFETLVQKGVDVIVGRDLTLNLELKVGAVTQQVEVTSSIQQVELNNSTISGSVEATTIRELPLNGRDWVQLTLLQAGIAPLRGANPVGVAAISPRLESGEGQQLALSGGRPEMLVFLMNGISIMDYANTTPGAATGHNLGVDSIQEFSTMVSTPGAAYGRTASGVVTSVVRSGTNSFHGSGFAFFRNSALDAKNYFDLTDKPTPPFYRHQYGGSIGGPIKKDSTFFFFNYEGSRDSKTQSSTGTTISDDARNGTIVCQPGDTSAGCSSGQYFHTMAIDAAVQPYLAAFPGAPGCLGASAGPGDPNAVPPIPPGADFCTIPLLGALNLTEDYYIGRIDHNFGSNDKFDSAYFYDSGSQGSPVALNALVQGDVTHRQAFTLEETHVFGPRLLNTWRGGYTRTFASDVHTLAVLNPVYSDASLGTIAGLDMPGISIAGVGIGPGANATDVTSFNFNTFQMYDDLIFTRGSHTLKFGGGFEYDQDNYDSPNGHGGAWSFNSVEDFYNNIPAQLISQIPGLSTKRGVRQTIYGIYFQDDIRLRSNFTVNLGLRYERATTPGEVDGLMVGLRNLTDTTPTIGSLFVPSWMGFSPRIGLAWDPFHDGKTAIRAGFGIYDALPLLYQLANRFNRGNPFYQQVTIGGTGAATVPPPPGSFPCHGFTVTCNIPAGANSLVTVNVEHNPHRSYLTQWNLNIQRDLGHGLAAQVGYIGSRGTHLSNGDYDENTFVPQIINGAPFWDPTLPVQPQGGACPSATHDPSQALCYYNSAYSQIYDTRWDGISFYNGLQATLTKRMSNGLQFQGSYTWSKSIDTNSIAFSAGGTLTGIANPVPLMPKINKGVSDFNVPHGFVFNWLYDIPGPHWDSGIANGLATGWEVGGILTAASGEPFTFVTLGDDTGTGSHSAFGWVLGEKPQLATTPGCANPLHLTKTLVASDPLQPNNLDQHVATYADLSCFVSVLDSPATVGRIGNERRNSMHTTPIVNLDFSLYKNNYVKQISENFNVQLRFEFFNLFNHTNLGFPQLFSMVLLPGFSLPGQAGYTATPAREIQMGVRIIF